MGGIWILKNNISLKKILDLAFIASNHSRYACVTLKFRLTSDLCYKCSLYLSQVYGGKETAMHTGRYKDTVADTKIQWQIQRYSGRYKDTVADTKIQWQMRRYSGRCKDTLADTKIQWQVQRYSGRYKDTVADTKIQWQIQRYTGRYKDTVADTKIHWQIQRYSGRYKDTLADTKIQWQGVDNLSTSEKHVSRIGFESAAVNILVARLKGYSSQ